jgi:hypothetical protein
MNDPSPTICGGIGKQAGRVRARISADMGGCSVLLAPKRLAKVLLVRPAFDGDLVVM